MGSRDISLRRVFLNCRLKDGTRDTSRVINILIAHSLGLLLYGHETLEPRVIRLVSRSRKFLTGPSPEQNDDLPQSRDRDLLTSRRKG